MKSDIGLIRQWARLVNEDQEQTNEDANANIVLLVIDLDAKKPSDVITHGVFLKNSKEYLGAVEEFFEENSIEVSTDVVEEIAAAVPNGYLWKHGNHRFVFKAIW